MIVSASRPQERTQRAVSKANRRAQAYGAAQQLVVDMTIHDFVAWVCEQGRKAAGASRRPPTEAGSESLNLAALQRQLDDIEHVHQI